MSQSKPLFDATKLTSFERVMITFAVMTATVMQVLDTTIASVALPYMAGDLGASPDQISWVLTSYLVASAIVMPLTGYFTDKFGQREYLMFSIGLFVVASALCGLSANLPQIVSFRLLQGVAGAALVPLSQAIMVQVFPPDQRGKAMAIWGIGVMVGPILGPTIGGWITEAINWRWTFYVNLPVGLLSFFIVGRFVPRLPRKHGRTMDWWGFTLLGLAIGGLQYVLDRGNQDNWFSSSTIVTAAVVSVIAFIFFVWLSFVPDRKPVFSLEIFKDRNFTLANGVMLLMGLGMFGAIFVQPLMLEQEMNYPVLTTGMVLAPRGIASMIAMMIVGRIIGKVDIRAIILMGIVLSLVGSWGMTQYNLEINTWQIVWPLLFQGAGIGMIFVPLSTAAFSTLSPQFAAEAAGIYSLVRTVGSSIGISLVATLVSRHAQVAWNQLGGGVTIENPLTWQYLAPLHLQPDSPQGAAILGNVLREQANMLSYHDAFVMILASFLLMIPVAFALKTKNGKKSKTEIVPE
ncbi:DHA2 family efflux MFS transporter permease subunit [Halothiobacillus neapolitanus]|jgi:DHA2 family multidrug resistance protein|uniref:Drug resistance transporter, EmrB/QacA subfamily n=1 Tax=Halothiobacillus neapolitanus (strain ATCC 23641 / DSM 15147 / CIP 104769 / NCIMB 8539 / c2) TaxID=555778 RepID=D0KYI8_HALNC|nr:DHA2 family efflux MFS transporter permease subunit [Halothiobacillus neapolitanus]ACX95511.1 drug resistance transporter, EmrB/QacA subfamily [Halothiobacillus neapolitanus c2]OZB82543.1 MAG: MFS transporter [Halothiobacillus sp. 13-55-253]TDN65808.1 DHA2 family multidrug resistance protein [Halothiobacillus neapolitanus]